MMDPSGKINNTQQWVLQNREHNMKQPCDVCSQDPIEQNSKGHQPSVQLYAVYPFMAIWVGRTVINHHFLFPLPSGNLT